MTPDRLQQIEDLYHSALERESAERAVFINESCNGDEDLRREVESLLASHDQAGDFIETPVHEEAASLIADNQQRSMVGCAIGHYEIVELLGAGGMGEVYLARDETLGRQVALKLLPAYFMRDEARVHRFQQEARTASSLNHPNILTIYEISQLDRQHFIATEFIDGETLRERMAHTRLKLREALEIAIQVAAALTAAGQAGIAHRDVKPENIMIRRDGYVKVLDFGLAKLTEQQVPTARPEAATQTRLDTDPGMVMGTVRYMSPEQARGLTVDGRTDIWSLGAVLYEMVTGRTPFEGETNSHVIVSILEDEMTPISRYSPEASAELERIVNKALRKKSDERYQLVDDLLLDLRSLRQQLEIDAHLAHSSAPQGLSTPSSSFKYIVNRIKKHKRSLVLAVAAIGIVMAALAYFFYFAKAGETIDSIAVLPFVNVSGDPNTEYLSDGLSDGIISSLTQLPTLKVISQSSTLRFKGQPIDPKRVGRELGVRAILMGRLVQRGEDLSVSAELVDARDNRRLWAHQYNRKLADIMTMQEDISLGISEKLRVTLSPEERKHLAKRYTQNIEAYRAFLQGYDLLREATAGSAEKSIEYFERAIRIDPGYAPAYAALARAYYKGDNFAQLPEEIQHKIESSLRKAQELDNSLADVHSLLGAIRQDQGDWREAEKEFKRAVELNPNGRGVHWFYARYLGAIGRNGEAIAEAKRGLEIDPLSPLRVTIVAYCHLEARQYDQAIELLQRALQMDPAFAWAHANLGRAFVQKGMLNEAIAEFQKAKTLNPQLQARFEAGLAYAYALSGKKVEARKILSELSDQASRKHVAPIALAIVYSGLGEKDRAFEWLEKAYKDRSGPPYLAIDLMLDGLRSDTRFAELARRKGLAA